MELQEKQLNARKLDEAVKSKNGLMGSFLRSIWPLIKNLILEIAIKLLEDQRDRDFGKLAEGKEPFPGHHIFK